jgi:hypothetical protein
MFILGAEFPRCAGIPIQAKLAPLLLSEEVSSEVDKAIANAVKGK